MIDTLLTRNHEVVNRARRRHVLYTPERGLPGRALHEEIAAYIVPVARYRMVPEETLF